MKIYAVIGVPGTGKTTIFKKLINNLNHKNGCFSKFVEEGIVKYHHWLQDNSIVFGVYTNKEDVFAGTDKLSMAVLPKIKEWFIANKDKDYNVYFEGDRLNSLDFFKDLLTQFPNDFYLFKTSCDKELMEERYKERGSNQSETFLSGRKTKVANIESAFKGIVELNNNVKEDIDKNVELLLNSGKDKSTLKLKKGKGLL